MRKSGFPAMVSLMGDHEPAKTQCPMAWKPHLGDLQDMRSRRGHLVPSSLRFVEMELVHEPYDRNKQIPVLNYLIRLDSEKKRETGSIYRDPYKRDTPEGPGPVSAYTPLPHERCAFDPQCKKWLERQERKKEHLLTSSKLRSMAWSPPPSKLETPAQLYWNLGPGRTPGKTSRHLYQPRGQKPVSEWTIMHDMTVAAFRRRAMDTALINKCASHTRHGEIVRLKRMDKDAKTTALKANKLRKKHYKKMGINFDEPFDLDEMVKSLRRSFAAERRSLRARCAQHVHHQPHAKVSRSESL